MRSNITIKAAKDEIIIKLNPESTQEDIVEKLKKKLTELKRLYKTAQNPIYVTGKDLSKNEELEIKNLILDKIDVEIKFDSDMNLGLHGIKKSFSKEIESSETKFFKGSIRSGNKIEYNGSIVILGDVNFGAEVIAEDNVVVLGVLRGLAHAGAKGNKKAIIAASSIESLQIRIGDIIKEFEKNSEDEVVKRKNYAYVEDEQIIVE